MTSDVQITSSVEDVSGVLVSLLFSLALGAVGGGFGNLGDGGGVVKLVNGVGELGGVLHWYVEGIVLV